MDLVWTTSLRDALAASQTQRDEQLVTALDDLISSLARWPSER
jgi:hypothetical protein